MPRRRSPKLWLGAGLTSVMLVLSGCSTSDLEQHLKFGWPSGITDQADKMRVLWSWSCVAALAVGVIVWGLTAWTVIFHRKKTDKIPRQTAYNLPLELSLTAAPFVAIAVLFYFVVVAQNFVLEDKKNTDVTINTTAFKWNWEFEYPDAEVKTTGDPVSTVGTTEEIPILVLPAGKSVHFNQHSNDVIHSFWVIEFNFKLDVIPITKGTKAPTPYMNNFTVTLKKGTEGAYVGRCAELCGAYHAQMNFELRVVSPDKFDQYLEARQSGMSNANALSSIGEAPLAQSTKPFDSARQQIAGGS